MRRIDRAGVLIFSKTEKQKFLLIKYNSFDKKHSLNKGLSSIMGVSERKKAREGNPPTANPTSR